MQNTIRLQEIAQSTAKRFCFGQISMPEAVDLIETAHETERAYLVLAFASFLTDTAEHQLREELLIRLKRREWKEDKTNRRN